MCVSLWETPRETVCGCGHVCGGGVDDWVYVCVCMCVRVQLILSLCEKEMVCGCVCVRSSRVRQ